MDTQEIIAGLREEIARLSGALDLLTRGTKRIGRPRKNSVSADNTPIKQRKTRVFSAKQRREQSARAKAMWAARRAAKKKTTKS